MGITRHDNSVKYYFTMSSIKLLYYGLLIVAVSRSAWAQQKAKQKCNNYLSGARSTSSAIRRSNTLNTHHIVGGIESDDDEFPHMVALGYGNSPNYQWNCGGTLISEQFVLTVAHCVEHRELGVVKVARMGTRRLKSNSGKTIEVVETLRHPQYKPPSQYNDIALLKLKTVVTFSKSILPACLNTAFNVRLRTNKFTATGWGRLDFTGPTSDNLMEVDLNLYTHSQCRGKYKNVNKEKLANGIVDATQICAGGGINEEKDTCQGDSGGPLVMKAGSLFSVVGVTSFGKACGISNSPGVYTRVSAFVPWIEKVVWS